MSGTRGPFVLVLAGHDPTGGAGVDADREAAAALGARALCVETARTDQDGERVRSIGAREPEAWREEAERAALELGLRLGAIKTGLLPGARHVRAAAAVVARARAARPDLAVVVDPLLAASGGEEFLDAEGVEALLAELVPLGVVLTPNLPEGARLAGRPAGFGAAPEDRLRLARALVERGAAGVVVKGGHGKEDPMRELVLAAGGEPRWLELPRVAGGGMHGSGCRHASALAAGLALGRPLDEAAVAASGYVGDRLRRRN